MIGNEINGGRLPQDLYGYHSIYPMNIGSDQFSKILGYVSSYYKATNSKDGKSYSLFRIHGFRLSNEAAMTAIDPWRKLSHTGIISLHESFTSKAFGDNSLIFVYDLFPNAPSLISKYLSGGQIAPMPERILWSFVIQIASILKEIHSKDLAARCLDLTKVLVTGKNRFRLSCVGATDVVSFDSNSVNNIAQFQQEDLLQLGQMVLVLAHGSLSALHNVQKSVDYLSRNVSQDIRSVILFLLGKSHLKSIDSLMAMVGPRIANDVNSALSYRDFLEAELHRETETGRLVRILLKLGFLNERPEFDTDEAWSEVGRFYPLRLFRNYLFHQFDDLGNPLMDLGYTLQCLNKVFGF
ncbi:PAB-dependent poly(A)-specific ribonuclease subunit 3 [Phlyctochytrium planicorne]|nr:PAB-dependent poly(A)-specific ribonuclease subunit 3 [Phlyctochytrium planicorne]